MKREDQLGNVLQTFPNWSSLFRPFRTPHHPTDSPKKPLCFITFLIKMSLYYPMTKRIKFKLSVAFKVLPQPVKTHFSQIEYLIYMFMFLTLHLLKPPPAFLHIQVLAFLLTKPLILVCTTYPAFSLQLYYLHIQRSYISQLSYHHQILLCKASRVISQTYKELQ